MRKRIIHNYYSTVHQYYGCNPCCSPSEIQDSIIVDFHPIPNQPSFFIHLKIKGGLMSTLKRGQYLYLEVTSFLNKFAPNVLPQEGSFKFVPAEDNTNPEAVLVEQAPVKSETGEPTPTNERTFKFTGNSDEESISWKGEIVYDGDAGEGVAERRVSVDLTTDNWNVEGETIAESAVFNPDGTQS